MSRKIDSRKKALILEEILRRTQDQQARALTKLESQMLDWASLIWIPKNHWRKSMPRKPSILRALRPSKMSKKEIKIF